MGILTTAWLKQPRRLIEEAVGVRPARVAVVDAAHRVVIDIMRDAQPLPEPHSGVLRRGDVPRRRGFCLQAVEWRAFYTPVHILPLRLNERLSSVA